MPSLIPSFVFLPLDYSLTLFVGCSGNIDDLAGIVIDDDCAVLDGAVVVSWLESEELVVRIGIILAESEYSL